MLSRDLKLHNWQCFITVKLLYSMIFLPIKHRSSWLLLTKESLKVRTILCTLTHRASLHFLLIWSELRLTQPLRLFLPWTSSLVLPPAPARWMSTFKCLPDLIFAVISWNHYHLKFGWHEKLDHVFLIMNFLYVQISQLWGKLRFIGFWRRERIGRHSRLN